MRYLGDGARSHHLQYHDTVPKLIPILPSRIYLNNAFDRYQYFLTLLQKSRFSECDRVLLIFIDGILWYVHQNFKPCKWIFERIFRSNILKHA